MAAITRPSVLPDLINPDDVNMIGKFDLQA
jgi:hypothetical protein